MAAGIMFIIGRYVIPEDYQAARAVVILIGGGFLLFAIFGWADWVAFRFNVHMRDGRRAWMGPLEYYRDIAREVRLMDRNQLRAFEHLGPIEVKGYIRNGSMVYALHTPTIDVPMAWIADHLEANILTWPEFKPTHGMPDSINRDYVQAFTRLMVANNLADAPIGNRPARWKMGINEVFEFFGMRD
jgi:hypothetical protein